MVPSFVVVMLACIATSAPGSSGDCLSCSGGGGGGGVVCVHIQVAPEVLQVAVPQGKDNQNQGICTSAEACMRPHVTAISATQWELQALLALSLSACGGRRAKGLGGGASWC